MNAADGQVVFALAIGAEEWLRYYRDGVHDVVTRDRTGRTVRFPAHVLRRFVTRAGVHGTFRLRYDRDGRFLSIEQLS